jgi:hypothetical protein
MFRQRQQFRNASPSTARARGFVSHESGGGSSLAPTISRFGANLDLGQESYRFEGNMMAGDGWSSASRRRPRGGDDEEGIQEYSEDVFENTRIGSGSSSRRRVEDEEFQGSPDHADDFEITRRRVSGSCR